MQQGLKINKIVIDNNVTLLINGTINNDTCNILNEELLSLDYSNLNLTLDFSNASYITSAGLRVLLVARKKLSKETMKLVNVNDAIFDILSTTGFDSFFNIIKNNNINKDYNKEYNLSYASLLEKRVDTNPKGLAYIYNDIKYTFEDVDKGSQIIANDLVKLGAKKRSHIGICSTNSINYIYTFLAIQKIGGVAVLINPGLNSNEVNDLCQIGDVSILCYSEIPNITNFEEYKKTILDNPNIKEVYDISNYINLNNRFNEYDDIKDKFKEYHDQDDPCLIIFSSGSTGKPKAILSSAYSNITCIIPVDETVKYQENDVNLAFLPFFHIFGFETAISLGLLKGYYSIIPQSKKPDLLINLIDKYKCTIFNTVPTMMLKMINDKEFSKAKLSSLRSSYLGGAITTKEQMLMLKELMPNNHLGNLYGMSENACISITSYNDSIDNLTKTVGKPVRGMEIMIKDSKGNSLDKNQVGEICLKSNAMLVCYYKLDITKQPLDESGWLATGDLGFIDDNGYLNICGRIKDLIICGGENISPGEIEQVISANKSIGDVKVIGIDDEIKGEIVVACLTIKDGYEYDESSIRKYVESKLAKYKWPVYYVCLKSFPILGSGKIDKISLKNQVKDILQNK